MCIASAVGSSRNAAIMGAGGQVAGGVMGVIGALSAGKAKASGLKQQAAASERQAAKLVEVGADNVREMNKMAHEDVATSRVAAAKSGVVAGAGSAGDTEKRIVREYQRNAERYGEDVAAEEEQLKTQAHYLRKAANKARKAGRMAALGAGFEMAGSIAKLAGALKKPKPDGGGGGGGGVSKEVSSYDWTAFQSVGRP